MASGTVCAAGAKCPCRRLTPRQGQTLHRLLGGDSEKEAARAMGISRHTVHAHVTAIYARFGVNARGDLLAQVLGEIAPGGANPAAAASSADRPTKKHSVALTDGQRRMLVGVIGAVGQPARRVAHARTLLLASEGGTDERISELADVSIRTVERVRRSFRRDGMTAALVRRLRSPGARSLILPAIMRDAGAYPLPSARPGAD